MKFLLWLILAFPFVVATSILSLGAACLVLLATLLAYTGSGLWHVHLVLCYWLDFTPPRQESPLE